jgi:small-conductance mechanosensitive channel
MQDFLNQVYFGNTIYLYLAAISIILGGLLLIKIIKSVVLRRFKKWAENTDTHIDDFIIIGIERTAIPLLYVAVIYISLNSLTLHPKISNAIHVLSVILLTFFGIRTLISILRYSINSFLQKKGEAENREKQIRGIITIASFVLWSLGFIFLLDNLGFKISTVIAGLGIGGIAIALAAQTILGDLFSYFVIFFDRPFQIGDAINIAADKSGTVEYIGIKTTRLRSLGGEQLIVSNTDLVNSRIHNYKRMERRRVAFQLGVVYDTPANILAQVGPLIKEIITAIPDTSFDRAHFVSYGNFSLNFEVVYYVLSPDYNKYMDIHQEINLTIYREFEKRKILFAFPTQTLYLNNQNDIAQPKTELISEVNGKKK